GAERGRLRPGAPRSAKHAVASVSGQAVVDTGDPHWIIRAGDPMRILVTVLTLALSFCWSLRAAHSQTAAPVRRVTLDELVDRAKKSDRVEAARDKLRGAEARRDLVRAMWIPQLEITATGGPGPEITCLPSPEMCTSTNVKSVYRIGDQPTFRIDGTVTMPLYTFGKLSHGSDAADEGLAAAQASVEASRADVALEGARAYYGLKLAREILIMLEEGRGHVTR